MSSTGQKNKAIDIKKTSTLENKHRLKIKEFETEKDDLINLQNGIISLKFPQTSGLRFVQMDEFFLMYPGQKNSFSSYIQSKYLQFFTRCPL